MAHRFRVVGGEYTDTDFTEIAGGDAHVRYRIDHV